MRTQTTLVAAGVVALVLVISAVGLTGLVRHRLVDAERVAARVRADDVVALARTGRLPNPLAIRARNRAPPRSSIRRGR